MTLAAAVLVAAIISADLPVQVVFKGNPKARPDEKGCVSWWGPNILVTNSNTTIICASCKPNARGAPTTSWVSRSTSAGRTWSAPVRATGPGCGDAVYSRTTNTILQTTAPPRSEVGEFVQGSAACSPCCEALHKYCGAFVAKGAACLRCEQQHAAALRNATACKGDPSGKMQRFCGATPPPPSPPGPRPPPTPPTPPGALPGPIWAHQLPPLTAAQLAKCETGLSRSTDEAHTWSAPTLMSINNSLGPHYGGGGLNHGIQMRRGPHAGRLVLARRLNCKAVMGDHNEQQYFHSFALFSDDNGDSWTAGQLLPKGWTECQAAELVNGSLLMTSRMYGSPWLTPGHPQASDRRRGFARSDDGGFTWAEIWYLEDRQPEIMVGTCAHALSSDPDASPTVYYSHPGNYTEGSEIARANYTLEQSTDGGAQWKTVNRVYGPGPRRSGKDFGGAGYSDSHVVPDPASPGGYALVMGFQKTFQPPVPGVEGGGYDMAVARLPL